MCSNSFCRWAYFSASKGLHCLSQSSFSCSINYRSPSAPDFLPTVLDSRRGSSGQCVSNDSGKSAKYPRPSHSYFLASLRFIVSCPAVCFLFPYEILDNARRCTPRVWTASSRFVEKNQTFLHQNSNKSSLFNQSMRISFWFGDHLHFTAWKM